MKRILAFVFAFVFSVSALQVNAQRIQAYLSYCNFHSPVHGSYVETYLAVLGKSLVFNEIEDGKFQANVEVTMLFKQEDKIVDFDKFELLSNIVADTSDIDFKLIDQKRFPLKDGTYSFEVILNDLNVDSNEIKNTEILKLSFPENIVNISGIQLVESFEKTEKENILTKIGYDLIPYIVSFYPKTVNEMLFYAEIYNTKDFFGENEKFMLSYYIESFETNQFITDFIRLKKQEAKEVVVVFNKLDITNLPSGNYNLVIETRDKKNDVIASNRLFFQRSNPDVKLQMKDIAALETKNTFVNKIPDDSLKEFLLCIYPISTEVEKIYATNQIEMNNYQTMRQYFLNFWLSRDRSNPAEAWYSYHSEVLKADDVFSTPISRGYETERGRVYLQYGQPNAIADNKFEPSAYPYQIWHYYKLKNQSNRKFVFINTDLVTNDYELIHSDAIGEPYNQYWKMMVYGRDQPTNDPDQTNQSDHFGSKLDDFFTSPR